jgi:hypothetical protein
MDKMFFRSRNLLSIIIGLMIITEIYPQSITDDGVLDIGSRRELFVDNYLIDKLTGQANLALHKPAMKEVVLVHDAPWEGNTSGYHVIFQDGDLYRMYYRASDAPNFSEVRSPVTCCAISIDGIHWRKPNFGIIEFEGSKANNIVWSGRGSHNFHPFLDKNPACKSEQKYKAVGGLRRSKGLWTFYSADGIHWQELSDKPMLTDKYALDSDNIVFWDSIRKEYRCFFRNRRNRIRDIMTCTSKDFIKWSEPEFLEYPDSPIEHLYTNMIVPYKRTPHLFVGFPSRFIKERGEIVEPLFMTSRDGVTFKRWEESIIRPGLNEERWLNRSNYIWYGLVETESDLPGAPMEISLYTNERYYTTEGTITRRYTYRMDGFVSIHAPFEGGEVITKPLTFQGRHLQINYSSSAAGWVKIEIQDEGGNPVQGFTEADCAEIYGDQIDCKISWMSGDDVSSLEGRPIRLRFILKDADIFSFQFIK